MAWTYILRGASGRYYFGSTDNLQRRFNEHRQGRVHTTKRFGGSLKIAAAVQLPTIDEARVLERKLKRLKNPRLALAMLNASQ